MSADRRSKPTNDNDLERRKNNVPDAQRKARHEGAISQKSGNASGTLIPDDLRPKALSRNFLQHHRALVDAGCHTLTDAEPLFRRVVAQRLESRKGSGILTTVDLDRARQEWVSQFEQQRRSPRATRGRRLDIDTKSVRPSGHEVQGHRAVERRRKPATEEDCEAGYGHIDTVGNRLPEEEEDEQEDIVDGHCTRDCHTDAVPEETSLTEEFEQRHIRNDAVIEEQRRDNEEQQEDTWDVHSIGEEHDTNVSAVFQDRIQTFVADSHSDSLGKPFDPEGLVSGIGGTKRQWLSSTRPSNRYQGTSLLARMGFSSGAGAKRPSEIIRDDDNNDTPSKRRRYSTLLEQDVPDLSAEEMCEELASALQRLNAVPSGTFLDRVQGYHREQDDLRQALANTSRKMQSATERVHALQADMRNSEQARLEKEHDATASEQILRNLSKQVSASLASTYQGIHDQATAALRDATARKMKCEHDMAEGVQAEETFKTTHASLAARLGIVEALLNAQTAFEQARKASMNVVELTRGEESHQGGNDTDVTGSGDSGQPM